MRASLLISQPVGGCQLHSEWGCRRHANHLWKRPPRNAWESVSLIPRRSFSSAKYTTKLNYHREGHAASSRGFFPPLHLLCGTTLQKVRGLKAGNHRESWETRDHSHDLWASHLTCAVNGEQCWSSTKGAPQPSPDLGVDVGSLRVPDVLWNNDKVLQRYFVLVPSCSYDEALWPKQLTGRKGLLCHSLTLTEVSAGIQIGAICLLIDS